MIPPIDSATHTLTHRHPYGYGMFTIYRLGTGKQGYSDLNAAGQA